MICATRSSLLPAYWEKMECGGSHLSSSCVGPATLRCGSCGALRYCSRKHQKAHWREHAEACGRMAKQMEQAPILYDFPFSFTYQTTQMVDRGEKTICSFLEGCGIHGQGLWRAECDCFDPQVSLSNVAGWHLPSRSSPCTDPQSPPDSVRNWEEYYRWRGLPLDSPVALLLHWPLTLYKVLRLLQSQTGSNLLSRRDQRLRIHYLGPERELYQLPVFGELLALLPGVQIQIDFIGPAVPTSRNGEVLEINEHAKCLDVNCSCKGKVAYLDPAGNAHSYHQPGLVSLKLWQGLYHEVHSELGTVADLIFAANAGIAAFLSWRPTIDLIKALQVPAFFTDYCEEAAVMAAGAIALVQKPSLTFPVQVNPFRQPLSSTNKVLDLPTFSNAFILGMNSCVSSDNSHIRI